MKNKAFTLIELMIVVVILGILFSLGFANYVRQQWKAKLGVCKTNVKLIYDSVLHLSQENISTPNYNPTVQEVSSSFSGNTIPNCPANGSYSWEITNINGQEIIVKCENSKGPFLHGKFNGKYVDGDPLWNTN